MKMSLYESGAKELPRRRKVREREESRLSFRGSMEETSVLMSTLNHSNTILDYRLLFFFFCYCCIIHLYKLLLSDKQIELIIRELIS